MVKAEAVNGVVQVGDRVAYPGSKGMVLGTVVKIMKVSSQGWNGVDTGIRVYVKRDNYTGWNPKVIIRRESSLVRVVDF